MLDIFTSSQSRAITHAVREREKERHPKLLMCVCVCVCVCVEREREGGGCHFVSVNVFEKGVTRGVLVSLCNV